MSSVTTDLTKFQSWRDQLSAQAAWMKGLDEWLFTNASSVLLSEKPGELLNLELSEFDCSETQALNALENRCREWNVEHQILRRSGSTVKLIIYAEERVERRLTLVPQCVLTHDLGYPQGVRAHTFLRIISQRWNETGRVPHEIGFVLGYHVDDVMGFMGMLPLECKGFCGWRVYGDLGEAQRLRRTFLTARCRALEFLEG